MTSTMPQMNDTLERVNRQLSIIEQLIERLTENIALVDMSKLTLNTQLSMIVKLMEQHSRTLRLRNSCGKEEAFSHEQELIARLLRQINGDVLDREI